MARTDEWMNGTGNVPAQRPSRAVLGRRRRVEQEEVPVAAEIGTTRPAQCLDSVVVCCRCCLCCCCCSGRGQEWRGEGKGKGVGLMMNSTSSLRQSNTSTSSSSLLLLPQQGGVASSVGPSLTSLARRQVRRIGKEKEGQDGNPNSAGYGAL